MENKKTILLVEDDHFLSTLLKTRLETEGYNVILVGDGDAALNQLENISPDLMLLDIILPNKSGFETLEAIMSNPKYAKVPVVVLSNLGQDSDITQGKRLGAIDYLVKAQLSLDDIVLKVKEHLNG